DPLAVGYVDVVADRFCAPNDALAVINYINSHPLGGEGEGSAASPLHFTAGSDSGRGEGEGAGQVQVPQNAADYYAQNPVHFLNIRGTDQPCTCAACMAARAAADTTQARSASEGPAFTQARSASEGPRSEQLLGDLNSSSAK